MSYLSKLFSLDGKVAVVTGASSGLGQAMAVALAQAGANLALVSAYNIAGLQQTAAQVQAVGRKAVILPADLATEKAPAQVVTGCLEAYGRLDILVNNAGTIVRAPAEDFPLPDWERVMDINARAAFLLTQLAGRQMLKQGSGKVINIASLLSFQGGIRVVSYAASKGAIAQMTKAFANEWAGRGINVNAIAPGYMVTNNTKPLRDDPKRSADILARIPAGRWGDPEDLAGAVVYLASPAADYVHGHVLTVDGGWMGR